MGIAKYPLKKASKYETEKHVETTSVGVRRLRKKRPNQVPSGEGRTAAVWCRSWWAVSGLTQFHVALGPGGKNAAFPVSRRECSLTTLQAEVREANQVQSLRQSFSLSEVIMLYCSGQVAGSIISPSLGATIPL